MAPSSQETPTKGSKNFSITRKLRDIAIPTRSPTLRKLVLSSLSSRSAKSTDETTQIKAVSGRNTDNLAGWMSSIRKRARLALLQDDNFEQQTESQIEKARCLKEQETSIENDEIVRASDSFNKLGEILSKKRVIESVQPHLVNQDEKRQKIAELYDVPFIEEEEKQPIVHKSDISEEEQFPEEDPEENYYQSVKSESKSKISIFHQKSEEEEEDDSDEGEEEYKHAQTQSDSDSDIIVLSGSEDADSDSGNEAFIDDINELEDQDINSDKGCEMASPGKYSDSSEEKSDDNENYSYSDEEEETEDIPVDHLLDVQTQPTVHNRLEKDPTDLEDSDIEEIIDDNSEEVEQEESEDESGSSRVSEAGSSSHELEHDDVPVSDSANFFASEEYSSHIIDPSFTNIHDFGVIPQPTTTHTLHQFSDVAEDLVSETQLAHALQNLADSAEIHHQFHHEQVNRGEDHFVPRSEAHELISNDIIETLNNIPGKAFSSDTTVKRDTEANNFDKKEYETVIGIGINGLPIKDLNFHDITVPVKSDTTVNFSFGQSFIHQPSSPKPLYETNQIENNPAVDMGIKGSTTSNVFETNEKIEEVSSNGFPKSDIYTEDFSSSSIDHKEPVSLSAPIAFGVPTLNSSVGYSFGERFYTPVESKPVINTKQNNIIKISSKFGSFAASVWADLSSQKPKSLENHDVSARVDASANKEQPSSESFNTKEKEALVTVQESKIVEAETEGQNHHQDEESKISLSPEPVAITQAYEEPPDKYFDVQPQKVGDKIITEDTEMPDIDEGQYSDNSLSLRAQTAFTDLGGIDSIEQEESQMFVDIGEADEFAESEKGSNDGLPEQASIETRSPVRSDSEDQNHETFGRMNTLKETQSNETKTSQEKQIGALDDINSEKHSEALEKVVSEHDDGQIENNDSTEAFVPIDPLLLQQTGQPTMQAEELDESDESVIVLDEVSVSQRSKEDEDDDDESASDQSEKNYTLNETAKPDDINDNTGNSVFDKSASDLAILPNEQDIQSVSNVSEDQVGENSTGNASVQTKDKSEELAYNTSESFQNELDDSSDSDAAGNHSLFFIDQLNEVESTQIEDSDSTESSKAEDDEVNLGSPIASKTVDQSELDEIVLSRIEQEILNEEVKNLAEEVPELNAEELIDQGTPVSPKEDDTDAPNTVIKTSNDELKDNNKDIFVQDDSDSALEKVKENISTYLMDNPTSDDYLYEARMQEAAATSVHEQVIQSTVTVEHADVLGNTVITEDVVENSHQSQTVIFLGATSNNFETGDYSGGEEDEIQIENFAIQKTTEDLESNFAVATEKVHTPSSPEETEFAAEHPTPAAESEAEDPVPEVKLEQDKSENPSNFKAELELAKYNNDHQPKPASIDNAEIEQDDIEEQSLKIERIDDNEEQDSFKVKVESKFLGDELSTFDNQQQDAMDIDRDEDVFNGETLEADLQKDIKMEDIAENENDSQPDTTNKNKEIKAFLEKLAKTSDNEDDIKDDIKQDEDEQNEYNVYSKSNIDSDVDKSASDDDSGKDEKPVSTKLPLRRTKRIRVLTKKSAFLAEVLKQQKRKTWQAAAVTTTNKEESMGSQVALSPTVSTTATKRTPKERKTKLETTKKQKALRRARTDPETLTSNTEGATNSPPGMSLRSGRRIATGIDTAAATTPLSSESGTNTETASSTTSTKGRGSGNKAMQEAKTASKGPVTKKAGQGSTGKRKGRGKSRKH